MSFQKVLGITAIILFGSIVCVALFKSDKTSKNPQRTPIATPIEVRLDEESKTPPLVPAPRLMAAASPTPLSVPAPIEKQKITPPPSTENLPEANRVAELFNKDSELPIVETITYKSRVSWLKGRPAWLSDYASHYQTSRHFIARSLHGKPDYFKQELADGDRFNVLRKDKNLQFYLVVDTSRCRMWLYYYDKDANEKALLKTYRVCLGRPDSSKASGLLTPLGKYTLGNKIAIYKPKMMGVHNTERVEMITVFGTRWIPFDKEISGCTAPAKGFGIHGVPWVETKNGWAQDISSVGKYQSDGCIRLATEDVEEIFAIVITKPTFIEVVRDFYEAKLPGS